MQVFGSFIERLLWQSRYIIIIPVLASLLIASAMILIAAVDAIGIVGEVFGYLAATEEARNAIRLELISSVIQNVDNFLLAAILIIFGLGLYELFIGKIDAAEKSEFASRLLLIKTLDALKARLGSVVLLILIVKFFQTALRLKYNEPLDLLYLGIGIILIGGALYLSSKGHDSHAEEAH
jgi:uncharacterized membrane protein YqhA